MKKGGLYVLGHVKTGSLLDQEVDPCGQEQSAWLSLVDHLRVKAFVEMTMTESVRAGTEQLVRVAGIGAMKPNTILLGFRDSSVHSDDLSSTPSAYFDPKFQGSFLSVGERTGHDDRISSEEYVGIIQDTLKMHKNIGLCRNFQHLDRTEVFHSELKFRVRAGKKKYLDVWPVNFFSHQETDVSDNTALFLFQLACIVNMVPKWKTTKLRVFMCVRAVDNNVASKEEALQRLLELLRIPAETYVLVWDHLASMLEDTDDQANVDDLSNVSDDYLKEANEFIRAKCGETAVSFIYLPRPPTDPSHHNTYLRCLDSLTIGLPPTLLIHGVSPVMTTTL